LLQRNNLSGSHRSFERLFSWRAARILDSRAEVVVARSIHLARRRTHPERQSSLTIGDVGSINPDHVGESKSK
jgi:hypothetical protein